jgi:UDP:flavonoid glycosyltransferase YjiC (YdhE family)
VRVLFTFVGGLGHFEPLAPVARAALRAGHLVAFGCGRAMAPTVEAAGFEVLEMGREAPPLTTPKPLLAPDRLREERDLRDRFVRRAARNRVSLAIAACEVWRPDVIVCDETDFGCLVAAERLGLPYATVLVIATGAFVRAEVVGEALDELRGEHGLSPDPELAMLRRYLVLSPIPASYRDPAYPLPETGHLFREPIRAQVPDGVPPGFPEQPALPTVYVTLGSVFNMESGDVLERVIEGLRGLPVRVVVTTGQQLDPAALGPQPANVHVARYIPQASVLPYCQLLVSHGGSGSVLGALAHGLPSLVLPIGADQPLNAERCLQLGVSQVLDPVAFTTEAVRVAAVEVLEDSAYRRNAERMRDEIAAMPGPGHAVDLLERLGAERQPVLAVADPSLGSHGDE